MLSQKIKSRGAMVRNMMLSIQKETRAATLFIQTVSEITGIHSTDIRCLDFLSEVKSATAGDLAKITGLTTGAITAVIDRLVAAGFVKREADKNDRRKIIITLITESSSNLKLVRDLFANQIPKLLSEYNVNELQVITDWNIKLSEAFHSEIEKLKRNNNITPRFQ
jgi:DNA-binding MarR family transcriptional regulator